MNNSILEEIKKNINKEYFKKFPLDFVKKDKFIPIDLKNDVFYVGIVNADDKQRRTVIVSNISQTIKTKIKIIPFTETQFDEILKHCIAEFDIASDFVCTKNLKKNEDSNIKNISTVTKKKLGEILIEEGLITQEQLERSLEESKITKTPVGSALVKLGFITIEQLKETL